MRSPAFVSVRGGGPGGILIRRSLPVSVLLVWLPASALLVSLPVSALLVPLALLTDRAEASPALPRSPASSPAPPEEGAAENLLSDGGFEQGSEGSFPGWIRISPPGLDPAPTFGEAAGARSGERAASLSTGADRGYSSFTQRIDAPPAGARAARLEGWIRAETADTKASLMLLFYDPERPDAERLFQTARKLAPGAWTRVEIETLVPEGTTRWMVRCGILGKGAACFDDVSLVASDAAGDLVGATLAVATGKYFLVPSGSGSAWIELSVPIPIGGQTPLAIRVASDPEDAVAEISLGSDRENFPLRVRLAPGLGRRRVALRAETLVLLRDRPLSDGSGTPLPGPRSVPADARVHLRAAPGVDAGDPLVKRTEAGFSRKDFGALVADLARFLREKLEYVGGGNQGAKECMASGKAVCTGYANVAASLLIASGVPARILACTQTEGRLQEHYVVEAWAPGIGWSRIETTMAAFPWPDSRNIVLRIVYPDAKRSPLGVPLFVATGGAREGGFDGDPKDGCWQSAETIGTYVLEAKEAEAIEAAARKACDALAQEPAKGAARRLAPPAASLPAGTRGALRVLEEAEGFAR